MPTWFIREKVTRTKEYVIPASQPWGATHDQVLQAIHAAREAYARNKMIDASAVSDDSVRVFTADDEIIVRIILEGQ